MAIEVNTANGYLLTGEHAGRLYSALDEGFDEAMRTAEQLLEHHDGIHVWAIEFLPDGSIQITTTDHLLGDTIYKSDRYI